jgi:hypothetical protein
MCLDEENIGVSGTRCPAGHPASEYVGAQWRRLALATTVRWQQYPLSEPVIGRMSGEWFFGFGEIPS